MESYRGRPNNSKAAYKRYFCQLFCVPDKALTCTYFKHFPGVNRQGKGREGSIAVRGRQGRGIENRGDGEGRTGRKSSVLITVLFHLQAWLRVID